MTFSSRVGDLWSPHDTQSYIYDGVSRKGTWIYNQRECFFSQWNSIHFVLAPKAIIVSLRHVDLPNCVFTWGVMTVMSASRLWNHFPVVTSVQYVFFRPWIMRRTQFLIINELSSKPWDFKHSNIKLSSSKPSLYTSLNALWEIRHTNRDITSFKKVFLTFP